MPTLSPSLSYILEGLWVTLGFTIPSVTIGFVWGSILALCKISDYRSLRWFANGYTSIFRGTPLILQLSLIYFAIPRVFGYNISVFEAGILTFSLNSGAYVSEIIRAGIAAVDKGQWEAAYSLGLPQHYIFKDIIAPQAIRKILPSLVNEVIDMIKESSLISIIGGADLMRRATIIAARDYTYFEPYLIVGACYYLLVTLLSWWGHWLEIRLSYDHR